MTFEQLLGFSDSRLGYNASKNQLAFENNTIISRSNGKAFSTGTLEIVSLSELREQVSKVETGLPNNLNQSAVSHKCVKEYIRSPDYSGALFQVASQFNLLEMAHYSLTPERGVGRYWNDPTQGPRCSQAAIGATLYRNYFLPMENGDKGQTANNQINCLEDVLMWISIKKPFDWKFKNGYIFIESEGFAIINQVLDNLSKVERDKLRGMLQIGIHWDVQINDECNPLDQQVSQIFCSAFPIYHPTNTEEASSLAKLILEATQEATVISAILNKERFGNNQLVLTKPGGGEFGNESIWICDALKRALNKFQNHGLDILIHHYSTNEPCYYSIEV